MKNKLGLNKLRNRVWLYFIVFTVLLVSFIWLLQTVFFEYHYEQVRSETMDIYADLILSDLDAQNGVNDDYVLTLNENGIDTILIEKNDLGLFYLYPAIEPINKNSLDYNYFDDIINNLTVENKTSLSGSSVHGSQTPTIFTARKVNVENKNEYLILVSSMVTLQDTVRVLRNQLITVALIVIIISFFVSYVISGKISRPIDSMSAVAERWGKGDENVEFKGGSYAELDELAIALNKAKTEVDKSGKLQRDLVANVSHDLKTPLTMIKAYAEMIKDISGDNKEKRDRHTQVIIDESDRLTLLVNDILSLSKIQSDADPKELTTFNLSELIDSVLMRFEVVLAEKDYKIVKEVEKDVFITADERRISEVVYNLVGNAVNYTGDDKTVKVFLTVDAGVAIFEVIDSGLGISEDKIETIWEKYYRYSETHKRTVKGTGLGLSIVKAILDSHNLEYGVISKENLGSNFYVKFNVQKRGE